MPPTRIDVCRIPIPADANGSRSSPGQPLSASPSRLGGTPIHSSIGDADAPIQPIDGHLCASDDSEIPILSFSARTVRQNVFPSFVLKKSDTPYERPSCDVERQERRPGNCSLLPSQRLVDRHGPDVERRRPQVLWGSFGSGTASATVSLGTGSDQPRTRMCGTAALGFGCRAGSLANSSTWRFLLRRNIMSSPTPAWRVPSLMMAYRGGQFGR